MANARWHTIFKKDIDNFSKKYIPGITKASAFEWYASFVLSPPSPSNEPCDKSDQGIVLPSGALSDRLYSVFTYGTQYYKSMCKSI